jgi:hypothetical protein
MLGTGQGSLAAGITNDDIDVSPNSETWV